MRHLAHCWLLIFGYLDVILLNVITGRIDLRDFERNPDSMIKVTENTTNTRERFEILRFADTIKFLKQQISRNYDGPSAGQYARMCVFVYKNIYIYIYIFVYTYIYCMRACVCVRACVYENDSTSRCVVVFNKFLACIYVQLRPSRGERGTF